MPPFADLSHFLPNKSHALSSASRPCATNPLNTPAGLDPRLRRVSDIVTTLTASNSKTLCNVTHPPVEEVTRPNAMSSSQEIATHSSQEAVIASPFPNVPLNSHEDSRQISRNITCRSQTTTPNTHEVRYASDRS